VAKHVLHSKDAGFPQQGTRIPKNIDEEPDPDIPQKSAEATIRDWRKVEHYRQNVRLQRNSISNFNEIEMQGRVKT
jgi:hypothetical protein